MLLLHLLKAPTMPLRKTSDELPSTPRAHYSPAPSTMMERFRFYNRSHRDGELINQFEAALRSLYSTCAFGYKLDSLPQDRVVCGANSIIQSRTLEHPDPTLDDTRRLLPGTPERSHVQPAHLSVMQLSCQHSKWRRQEVVPAVAAVRVIPRPSARFYTVML